MVFPRVPLSDGFDLPLMLEASKIPAALLAVNTLCFLHAECNHWSREIESVQCVTLSIRRSCSSTINFLNRIDYSADEE